MELTEQDIRNARTTQELAEVVANVELRELMISSDAKPTRAILVESLNTSVFYMSGPDLLWGTVVSSDYRGHRDFIIKLDGADRKTAERIANHLEYVGDE